MSDIIVYWTWDNSDMPEIYYIENSKMIGITLLLPLCIVSSIDMMM